MFENKQGHFYLKNNPGLFEKVGLHVGPDDLVLLVKVDLDELSEP